MLFDQKQDLDLQPRRTKTLLISLGIHLLLVALIAINPEFLSSTPKRIIRIAGQDYDLSKNQLTELVMPPEARPKPPAPANDKPLIQPPPQPNVQPPQPPPPPPPPPPPAPQAPPVVISPEDVIADGARPDAPPKPSRGDTRDTARAGSEPAEPPKPAQPKPEEKEPTQIARNTNPNALRLPNFQESAGRIVQQDIEEARKRYTQGPRTGLPGVVQEDPNFSTAEPTILSDTRGYDFGPYMNQVVNRVRVNWYSLIPEVARLGKKGRVVIIFTIAENGGVQDLRLVANSGTEPLDRAATGAITASNPFQKLPPGFDGDHLVLQFTFLYNIIDGR
jgi:TonB family protein